MCFCVGCYLKKLLNIDMVAFFFFDLCCDREKEREACPPTVPSS